MKRITVEEVKEAYAATGLHPLCGYYLQFDIKQDHQCGCPMAAVAICRTPELLQAWEASDGVVAEHQVMSAVTKEFPDDYRIPFTRSFDGHVLAAELDGMVGNWFYDGDSTHDAYLDGLAVRAAFPELT